MADLSKIPNFTPSADPEVRQLQEVVWELKEILEDVVKHPRPAIAGRHHERLRAAWEDAMRGSDNGEDRFASFMKNLDGQPPGANRSILENVGLTDAPLDLKLGVYHHARDDYLDYGTAEDMQSEPESQRPRWRKLLGRVLQTASVILGSTASEIPGGEYLKELVEDAHLLVELTGDLEELFRT